MLICFHKFRLHIHTYLLLKYILKERLKSKHTESKYVNNYDKVEGEFI